MNTALATKMVEMMVNKSVAFPRSLHKIPIFFDYDDDDRGMVVEGPFIWINGICTYLVVVLFGNHDVVIVNARTKKL